MSGWIKLHRKLCEKAFYSKDSEKVHLWVHLLMSANHAGREELLGGKPFFCASGQFTTGRKQLSSETGISESKIERILTYFEKIEQQIEQQKTSTNRLISILNWGQYQQSEQQIEQQVNNDRTTSEQRVNNDRTHLKNDNNERMKEEKNIGAPAKPKFTPPSLLDIQTYCTERKNNIDPGHFFDYNEARGWMIGKNKMKDWKAAIRTWEKSGFSKPLNNNQQKQPSMREAWNLK